MAPEVPEDVLPTMLDRQARTSLRTLSKENADGVAKHLVMAGRLVDVDPELAHQHAQEAVRRAGRVDVVREAAGLAAYHAGHYDVALRELRTFRRLSGSEEHLPVMADCERGLGRPERALALAAEPAAKTLPRVTRVELALVVAGARLDLGDPEAALVSLATDDADRATGELALRVAEVRATALEAAGRTDEAAELRLAAGIPDDEPEDDVVVFDLADEVPAAADGAAPDALSESSGTPGSVPAPDADPQVAHDVPAVTRDESATSAESESTSAAGPAPAASPGGDAGPDPDPTAADPTDTDPIDTGGTDPIGDPDPADDTGSIDTDLTDAGGAALAAADVTDTGGDAGSDPDPTDDSDPTDDPDPTDDSDPTDTDPTDPDPTHPEMLF